MAYSEKARELRLCQATTKQGAPCRQYAVWGDSLRRCATHGGRVPVDHLREKTHATPCHCVAFPFPHRPGSSLCRWPDEPQYRLMMRPGTHGTGRQQVKGILGARPNALASWWLFDRWRTGAENWR